VPAHASDETLWKEFGKSRQVLIELVDRHTLTVQGWLSSRSPNAQRFVGKGIKASSTGLKVALLNLALGCNFPAGTSDEEVGKEIEAVKNFFTERDVKWLWWLNTAPEPEHVGKIAVQHGLEYDAPPLPAMAASLLPSSKTYPVFPKDIQVWRAETMNDLKAASTIRRLAFRFHADAALTYFEDMPIDWLETENVKLFLAGEHKDEPVAIGALIYAESIAGVYVMATHPDCHRKGFGKAIVSRLMAEAAADGHSIVALTASQKGFGLYSQFGFRYIFDFDFYSLTP